MFNLLFIDMKIIRLFLFYEQKAFNTKCKRTDSYKLIYYDKYYDNAMIFFIINT